MKVFRLARVASVVAAVLMLACGVSFAQVMKVQSGPQYQQWLTGIPGGLTGNSPAYFAQQPWTFPVQYQLGVSKGPAPIMDPGRVIPVERPEQLPEGQLGIQLVETTSLMRAALARSTHSVNGSGLTAAVLDTGLRTTHTDFTGRVVAQRNFTTDDDGNPTIVTDGNGHGTNVAGIIAAGGAVHTGIAPNANIIPLKVLRNDGGGEFAWTANALQWVIDNHATYNISVCNLSLGTNTNYTSYTYDAFGIRTRLQQLRELDIAVVIAAGNGFYTHSSAQGMSFPAICPESVSVGAVYDANTGGWSYASGAVAFTTAADRITPFSQRLHQSLHLSNGTDIFAPGAVLTSSGTSSDVGSSVMHGTSQAAPATAGAILLMQQRYKALHGKLPRVRQIEDWLRNGAVPIVDGDDEQDNVTNTGLTFLRADALNAVGLSTEISLPPPDEGFESGTLASYGWQTGGNANWTVTSGEVHSGSYSAKAGPILDNQSTYIEVTRNCLPGNISFYKRVSSELDYDTLVFKIDGIPIIAWSGGIEGEWDTDPFVYGIDSGVHTFRWEYTKDGSVSSFHDTAWIDDIIFPRAIPTVSDITPSSGGNDGTVNVTITGTGFRCPGGVTTTLTRSGELNISGTSVTVNSDTSVSCTFDLSGAQLGTWNVVVANAWGSGQLTDGFTVLPPHTVAITGGPSGTPNPVDSGGAVTCSATASDSHGHDLQYTWSAEGGAGSFDDPTAASPTWTAPANTTDAVAEYDITVTVTCPEDGTYSDTATYTQQVNPVAHTVAITDGPSGSPNPVYSAETAQCSVTAVDSRDGHTLSYQWTADGGTFDDATLASPQWTAPANTTQAVAEYQISVTVTCDGDPSVSDTATHTQQVDPVHEVHITAGPAGDPNPVYSEGTVQCSVTATDTLPHTFNYQWTAEGGAGSFDDPTSATPTWTAPANTTQAVAEYDITVTVSCASDPTVSDTATYTQQVDPVHEVQITAGPAGDPNPVYSEGTVQCSVTASETLGHDLTYTWTAEGDAGSFDDPTAATPTWTAPANTTQSAADYDITVTVTCATDPSISDTATYTQQVDPVHEIAISEGPAGDPNPVYSEGAVQCSVTAADTLGHDLVYAWSAEGGAGSFDDATAAAPTWTAPANTTQAMHEYEITVEVTCSQDNSVTATASYTQRVSPTHEVVITDGPQGDPNPVYSGSATTCSVSASDTHGHDLVYAWSAEGDAGSFDDPTSATPTWTAPPNTTQAVAEYEITVTVTCAQDGSISDTASYTQQVDPVHEVQITEGPTPDPNPVESGGTVNCYVVAEDTLGHGLSYAWSAEGGAGSFEDAGSAATSWTAPENTTQSVAEYEITVTVTCAADNSVSTTASFIQQVNPVHELAITEGPAGDPNPVESEGTVQCSVTAADTLGHDLVYQWSAAGGAGSFDDASAQNPTWTAPANNTQSVQRYDISVTVTCAEDGTVQATASYSQAVASVHDLQITEGPICDPNPVDSDGDVACSVSAADTLGHDLVYAWSAEGDAGSFDDASSRTPVWTAPPNISHEVQEYEITVTVTCAEDPSLSDTASCIQQVNPHEVTITAAPDGDPNPVYSEGDVRCSVSGADSLGHDLTYAWAAEGGAGNFDDPTSASPVWTAPANNTQAVQEYEITVIVSCANNAGVNATASYIQQVDPVHAVRIVQDPRSDRNPLYWQGTVQCSVDAVDSLGHDLTYEWSAVGDAGSFDDPTLPNPTWTAPPNETETVQDYQITVRVSCAEDESLRETASFVQRVEPLYEVTIADGPSGDPNPVVSAGNVRCGVDAEDTWGRQLTYAWSAEDESGEPVGSFDDSTARRPLWTAPEVSAPTTCTLTVVVTSTVNPEITATGSFEQEIMPCVSRMFAPGVHMVSLPTTPGRDASLRDLFGADRTALWDAAQQDYVSDRSQQWGAGSACWALFRHGSQHHVRISGTPYEGTTFSCDASDGWNQLGQPWMDDVPISALSSDGTGFRRIAWTYYDGGYHLIADLAGIPGVGTMLEAWRSYWVHVSEDCRLTVAPGAAVSARDAGIDLTPEGEDTWLVQLVASTATGADRYNYCGATSAQSGLSVANPPAVEGSVDLFFTSAAGAPSAIDLTSGLPGDSCEWTFAVRGAEAGQEVSLSCPDLSSVPGTHNVYLLDRDTGERVYMRTQPNYTYTAASDGERHFVLSVDRRSEAPVIVSAMEARQAGPGMVSMQYTLSVDATVEIEIMNIAGRQVRQLLSSAPMPAGVNSHNWNLRTGDGTVVPGGVYLVQLIAKADDGSQVTSLATLRVDR